MNWSSILRSDIMAGVIWRPAPDFGIRQLENEHDQLLGYVAELNEAMLAGEGCLRLRPILADVSNFATEHFQSEEELMTDFRYPAAQEHSRSHQEILLELHQMSVSYDSGHAVFAADLATVLYRWITTHVKQHDMRFGEFLMMNGNG